MGLLLLIDLIFSSHGDIFLSVVFRCGEYLIKLPGLDTQLATSTGIFLCKTLIIWRLLKPPEEHVL